MKFPSSDLRLNRCAGKRNDKRTWDLDRILVPDCILIKQTLFRRVRKLLPSCWRMAGRTFMAAGKMTLVEAASFSESRHQLEERAWCCNSEDSHLLMLEWDSTDIQYVVLTKQTEGGPLRLPLVCPVSKSRLHFWLYVLFPLYDILVLFFKTSLYNFSASLEIQSLPAMMKLYIMKNNVMWAVEQ